MAGSRLAAETGAEARARRARSAAGGALAGRYGLEFVDVDALPHRQRPVPLDPVRPDAALQLRARSAAAARPARRWSMADPTDVAQLDELELLLGQPIEVRVGVARRRSTRSCRSRSRPSACSTRRPRTSASSSCRRTRRARRCSRSTASPPTPRRSSSWSTRRCSTPSSAAPRDIHIETRDTEVIIKYRIDGVLYQAMEPIDKRHHQTIISRIKVMSRARHRREAHAAGRPLQAAPAGAAPSTSASRSCPSVHGEDCVIRILDKESMIDGVHEPPARHPGLRRGDHAQAAQVHPRALRHGAGDRTDRLRQDDHALRLPVRDPVAPRTRSSPSRTRSSTSCRGITQIPVNEKKGLTFARGLRSILRHDPDKIMVGEIRDEETAQIAIQSALTGHLVFTTVHANNVVDVLGRFLNMNVDLYNFVSALNCVLAQRLVRRICPHCQQPAAAVADSCSRRAGLDAGDLRATSRSTRATGCIECNGTGLPRPARDLRAARPLRPHPRADPGRGGRLRRSSARPRKRA